VSTLPEIENFELSGGWNSLWMMEFPIAGELLAPGKQCYPFRNTKADKKNQE
jgi:hypothetical protein